MRFEFDNYNMIFDFDFEQNKCSIAGRFSVFQTSSVN